MDRRVFDPFLKRRQADEALQELQRGIEQSRQEREQQKKNAEKLQRSWKWLGLKKKMEDTFNISFGPKRRIAQKKVLREAGLKYTDGNPHKMKLRAQRRRQNYQARYSRRKNRVKR